MCSIFFISSSGTILVVVLSLSFTSTNLYWIVFLIWVGLHNYRVNGQWFRKEICCEKERELQKMANPLRNIRYDDVFPRRDKAHISFHVWLMRHRVTVTSRYRSLIRLSIGSCTCSRLIYLYDARLRSEFRRKFNIYSYYNAEWLYHSLCWCGVNKIARSNGRLNRSNFNIWWIVFVTFVSCHNINKFRTRMYLLCSKRRFISSLRAVISLHVVDT